MTPAPPWLDANEIKQRVDCRVLAEALGLRVVRGGRAAHCFNGDAHSHGDRNPSLGLWSQGWKCYGCGLSGDAISLVCHIRRVDFSEALTWLASWLGLSCPTPLRRSPPPPPPADPAPRRLPLHEVTTVWEHCVPVTEDPEVGSFLEARCLDPTRTAAFDLARALPSNENALPGWARKSRVPWHEAGYRLILPVYGAAGTMESLRARWCLTSRPPERWPKGLAPGGASVRGLVMANHLARTMLGGALPRPIRLVVAEGEPDFLTWATRLDPNSAGAIAVVGVVSGSWTQELADLVPNESRVIIRTDHDPAGDTYAERIRTTLAHRCTILRSRPGGPPHAHG